MSYFRIFQTKNKWLLNRIRQRAGNIFAVNESYTDLLGKSQTRRSTFVLQIIIIIIEEKHTKPEGNFNVDGTMITLILKNAGARTPAVTRLHMGFRGWISCV
jgi:hypothetical protein